MTRVDRGPKLRALEDGFTPISGDLGGCEKEPIVFNLINEVRRYARYHLRLEEVHWLQGVGDMVNCVQKLQRAGFEGVPLQVVASSGMEQLKSGSLVPRVYRSE